MSGSLRNRDGMRNPRRGRCRKCDVLLSNNQYAPPSRKRSIEQTIDRANNEGSVKFIRDHREERQYSSSFASRAHVSTCFHSPVADILRSRGDGGGDTCDRGRVAQGDRERNDQNRGGHASSRSNPTRVTLVNLRGETSEIHRSRNRSYRSARARASARDRRRQKIGQVLAPGTYRGRYNRSAYPLIGYICVACARVCR